MVSELFDWEDEEESTSKRNTWRGEKEASEFWHTISEPHETMKNQVIPIFDGEKYDFWSIKMTTILKTRKLWSVVEEDVASSPALVEAVSYTHLTLPTKA